MNPLTVGEFKARFSEVMDSVRKGHEVVLLFGRKKQKLAVLVPYNKYADKYSRKIGVLDKKAFFKTGKGFKMTEEELLAS